MENISIIIEKSLGERRYIVTNSCKADAPIGTKFHNLWAEKSKRDGENFIVDFVAPVIAVNIEIVAAEFWRKPWHCIPYGHHASVILEGPDEVLLTAFLAQYASVGSSVCLSSGLPVCPVAIPRHSTDIE